MLWMVMVVAGCCSVVWWASAVLIQSPLNTLRVMQNTSRNALLKWLHTCKSVYGVSNSMSQWQECSPLPYSSAVTSSFDDNHGDVLNGEHIVQLAYIRVHG